MKGVLYAGFRALLVVLGILAMAPPAFAGCPGCCSSHGGISSSCASDGRIYCLDGSISPSCLCSTCGITPTCTGGRYWNGLACVCPTGTNWNGLQCVATPTCYGGQSWNGSACVCPAGQAYAENTCYTPLPANQCGVERWPVKTGTDAQASTVSSTPQNTLITALTALPAPTTLPQATRLAPIELSTFVLDATLISYSFEEDSDYHLVISDNAGRTMIVEIPHPNCVGANSPFRTDISATRNTFDNAFRATTSAKTTATPVRVTGVGFWDAVHGQRGVAPNGIELHPVLALQFHPDAPPPTGAGPSLYSSDYVQKAYVAYYGRPADPAGQSYWASRMDAEGKSLNAIIGAFGNSDEFNRRFGGLTFPELVTKVYQQALGRNPDPAGLAYYVGELQAGRRTLQSITLDVLNGATTAPDSTVVANKLDVATYFTAKVAVGCLYGTEQDGVSVVTLVTASPTSVTAAKASIDNRCGP